MKHKGNQQLRSCRAGPEVKVCGPEEYSDVIQELGPFLSHWSVLLAHGDAADCLPRLPDASVDLVITSPPYWGHRSYGRAHNWAILDEWRGLGKTDSEIPSYSWYREHGGVLGLEPLPDWYVHHVADILDSAVGCLRQSGSMWVNLGDTYFARWSSIREKGRQGLGDNDRVRRRTPMGGYRQEKQLLLVPARFAIEMQNRRWILRNDLVWHKPNVPPRPERDRLRLSHEHFFHFVRRRSQGRPKYYYDLKKVEQSRNDVVLCNVRTGKGSHSATFPEQLVRPRIESSSPPCGTVLDPFCGTGTALRVALSLGRRAIGFDTSLEYLTEAASVIASST